MSEIEIWGTEIDKNRGRVVFSVMEYSFSGCDTARNLVLAQHRLTACLYSVLYPTSNLDLHVFTVFTRSDATLN